MDPVTGLVIFTGLSIVLSHFCSLFEAALYAVPMSLVRVRAQEGGRPWRLMRRMKEHPDQPISGILITNTLANTMGATLAGAYAETVFQGVPGGVGLFSAFLVLAILWFSEIIPKTIGVVFASRLAPMIAWPVYGLMLFWKPLIHVIEMTTGIIKRKGGGMPTITEVELASLARQGASEGEIYRHEASLIERVLRLDTLRARELMTPRTVVDMVDEGRTVGDLKAEAMQWRHSRLPVYSNDNTDEVYGLVRRRDILGALARGGMEDKPVGELSEPLTFVPEGASAHVLLDRFLSSRIHIAAVIDEYGAYLGIVTLEDVLEALLGREIIDETDLHADMQRFARDEARKRGLPVDFEAEGGQASADSDSADSESNQDET